MDVTRAGRQGVSNALATRSHYSVEFKADLDVDLYGHGPAVFRGGFDRQLRAASIAF
jgi:hypothetical protein